MSVRRAPDVALPDEHARVVDALRQAQLEHQSLQAPLQEVLRGTRPWRQQCFGDFQAACTAWCL